MVVVGDDDADNVDDDDNVDDNDNDDDDDNDDDAQEELARKRQLPVPPMPRKGGVLARSEDNVSGGSLSLSWSSAWRSR